LVISNDRGNEHAHTVIVAPITSKTKNLYSFEARVSISGKDGKIMLDQCRAVDKSRLGKMECHVDKDVMDEVNEAIRIVFGLA
jgi:mRNA interferase MazF